MPYEVKRIDRPDDPERCQHCGTLGQCQIKAVTGSQYCIKHGGAMALKAQQKQEITNYNLTKWRGKLRDKTDSNQVYSLKEEIGLLRIMMEEIINHLSANDDPTNLLVHIPKVADLATRIEKLVLSCNKLDKSLGDFLDKKAVMQFAIEIVQIIADYITDTEQLEEIANKITERLEAVSEISASTFKNNE